MPPIPALQRLADACINLIPIDLNGYYAFERDGFMALVQRRHDDTFGQIGSAGLLTETGLAPLLWRGKQAFFASRSVDAVIASPDQVATLRRFQDDLQRAIHG